MEEIQIGEFIRTPYNNIEKVERIEIEEIDEETKFICILTNLSCYTLNWLINNKAKHSANIVNIIQVGDIIEYESGNDGVRVKREVSNVCTEKDDYKWGDGYVSTFEDEFIRHNQIYSVITKEKYEINKCEVNK